MNKTIIDTSAWINFFCTQSGVIGDVVSSLISQDQTVITGPVVSELLQGLKNRREGKALGERFSIIPYVEVKREDWEMAGELLCDLRQRGITVPLTVALIAIVAKQHGCSVLTLDRHFEHLEVPLHLSRN